MAAPRFARAEIAHVGGGTALLLGYAALIPGVVPTLALTALVTVVVLVPAAILALVGGLLAAPPLLIWRLATRGRRRRDGGERLAPVSPRIRRG